MDNVVSEECAKDVVTTSSCLGAASSPRCNGFHILNQMRSLQPADMDQESPLVHKSVNEGCSSLSRPYREYPFGTGGLGIVANATEPSTKRDMRAQPQESLELMYILQSMGQSPDSCVNQWSVDCTSSVSRLRELEPQPDEKTQQGNTPSPGNNALLPGSPLWCPPPVEYAADCFSIRPATAPNPHGHESEKCPEYVALDHSSKVASAAQLKKMMDS